MTIEIEVPLRIYPNLFDSNTISPTMSREAPGGATLRLRESPPRKVDPKRSSRGHYTTDAEPSVTFLVSFGSGVALHLFSSWLYDKLKSDPEKRKIRINRTWTEVTTPDAITNVIQESIEIEEHK
jgi:hypothetical protein